MTKTTVYRHMPMMLKNIIRRPSTPANRRIQTGWGMLYFIVVLLCNTSCEKVLLKPDSSATPMKVFSELWTDVNDRYAYFELKDINWDSIGVEYRKKIHEEMDEYALFDVLGDMLFELKDGHVNLSSHFNRSRNWDWFHNYPDNYDQNIVDRYYLKNEHYITGPLLNQVIDSVLYVNYRSFTEQISENHLDQLMERAEGMKGMIIDIRHNGGGNLQNGYALASCLIENPYLFAYQRFKTGPGHEDFSKWEKMTIRPRSGKRYSGQVIVLTNRRSYSASTFFAQMMRVIPHAILMGDHTGGGGGVPLFGELSNGWTYRFSASQTITPEGAHIEEEVAVDIRVVMNYNDERLGMDTIIENALEYLTNKNGP